MLSKEQIQIKRQFPNPLVEQRADPWIYKHTDGYYYFTASVPAYDCIELRRARSIEELGTAEPVIIWRKHVKGRMSGHIWAPELHYIDGKWYIYFAAGGSDEYETDWEIRMYVLENDARARWNRHGWKKVSFGPIWTPSLWMLHPSSIGA